MLRATAPSAKYADKAAGTLSREHSVVVDVPEAALPGGFRKIVDACASAMVNHCIVLESDISTGKLAAANIKVRVDPAGVEGIIDVASSTGMLSRRATKAEDMAESIADTQTRLGMLTAYRRQLVDLQGKVGNNVDAALKVASELSRTQSDLEHATGEAAYLTKRVTTDVVSIQLFVPERTARLRPIREAFEDFAENLSSGAAQAITGVAYLVPWLFVVLPLFFLVRFLWRRRR